VKGMRDNQVRMTGSGMTGELIKHASRMNLKVRSHQKRNYFFARLNPMKSQRTDACGCDRRNIFPGGAFGAAQFSPRVEIFKF